jgi:uncharacterized spore protein YtfJ
MEFCGRPSHNDDRLIVLIETLTGGRCAGSRSARKKTAACETGSGLFFAAGKPLPPKN